MVEKWNIQSMSVDDMFEERPVELKEFIESEDYLGLEELSEKQFDFVLHGSRVYHDSTYQKLGWKPVRMVTELVCEWGKGSGKDFCSGIVLSYIPHLLICLESPQAYYGKSHVSFIDMINMAYSRQ